MVCSIVIDIHSHIMPEIDDGAQHGRSRRDGKDCGGRRYRVYGLTPHMFNGLSNNPEPRNLERVAALTKRSARPHQ
jgi:tyrosine-protein phosphatase YwqE